MSESQGFPSPKQLDEAWRNAHNLFMSMQGIATLANALALSKHLAEQYTALQQSIDDLQTQRDEEEKKLDALVKQKNSLASDYEAKRDEADTAHEAYMTEMREEESKAKAQLVRVQQEVDALEAEAAALRSTMQHQAQQAAKAEQAQLSEVLTAQKAELERVQAEIAALEHQREQVRSELQQVLARVTTEAGV